MDVVIITPEPGRQKEIGQLLLTLADHPRDVQWVTYPVTGFSVPLDLFQRFDTLGPTEELNGDGTWEPTGETVQSQVAVTGGDDAPRRRRGRPRKEESTDNNTSEEE